MSDLLIGLIGIAATVFLGLLGIAIATFFGLKAFRTDITNELSAIKEKVIVIQETAQNVWDVIRRSPLVGAAGTIERNFTNLGKVKITAEPHLENTIYYLLAEKPIFDDDRISKSSKDTQFEEQEKKLFAGKTAAVSTPIPNRLRLTLPCTEPKVCADYVSLFLEWLNSTYYQSLPKAEDFEEPIRA